MNTDKSDKNKLIPLLGFLALVVGIAVLASFATHHSLEPWYRELKKPAWTPPSWVFPIVWPILYTLIALAGWHLTVRKVDETHPRFNLLLFTACFECPLVVCFLLL